MINMSRWLDVEVGTGETELNTLPSNILLIDLQNDNEYKLLIADLGRTEEGPKLKVFKGAMQIFDMTLPGLPLGVVGLYSSDTIPRLVPIIAVAYSSALYIYRNMKLFYKYYLPTIELSTSEMDMWRKLSDPANHNIDTISSLTETLKSIPKKILSIQSQNFLSLTPDEQLDFLEQSGDVSALKPPEIVCIAVMKLSSVDRYSVSCLVVGTDDGDIIILEPQTFTQISKRKVRLPPEERLGGGMYTVQHG